MSFDFSSPHLFALCNSGSEAALKAEVRPLGWRSGYQRRGFVTFQRDGGFGAEDTGAGPACARRLCLSLGKSPTRDGARELLRQVDRELTVHEVSLRRRRPDDDEPVRVEPGGLPERPRDGMWIGTVVELAEDEFWAGLHRHGRFVSPDPGGDSGMRMPDDAPSRAWLKFEEALRFFDFEIPRHEVVVEVGCAPGGVALALLRRGVPVVGVDPARMAEVVTAFGISSREAAPAGKPWFFHCRKPASLAGRRDLGHGVAWFMSDMNQSPDVVLRECVRFGRMAGGLRGALMNFKLTDLGQVVEKDRWREELVAMGFRTVRVQQFAPHHREVAVLALS